jgi:hypothetical protein
MAAVPEKNTPESGTDEIVEHRFYVEVWIRIRPYAVCFTADFLISLLLYVLQWGFKTVTSLAPIGGWTGTVILNLHSTGAVLVFALFIGLLVSDVIKIHHAKR